MRCQPLLFSILGLEKMPQCSAHHSLLPHTSCSTRIGSGQLSNCCLSWPNGGANSVQQSALPGPPSLKGEALMCLLTARLRCMGMSQSPCLASSPCLIHNADSVLKIVSLALFFRRSPSLVKCISFASYHICECCIRLICRLYKARLIYIALKYIPL